jgi:hypothetical protein
LEDKVQHFFRLALISYTWGPGAAKNIGRLYERLDQVKALFKDTGGYDVGDVHADDLGADFGFNARLAPTSSIRFFVRHPNETLGGAIVRLSNGVVLRSADYLPSAAGAANNSERGGRTSESAAPYDPQAEPKSTGFPLPSDYYDSDTETFGANASDSSDAGSGTSSGTGTGSGTGTETGTGSGTGSGTGTGTGTGTDGMSPSGAVGEVDDLLFTVTYVEPDGTIQTYVVPADVQPLEGTNVQDDDEDEEGYWPETATSGGDIDLVAALRKVEAIIWSNRRPAPKAVVKPTDYVPVHTGGNIDPLFEPQGTGGGRGPDPGQGPDLDPQHEPVTGGGDIDPRASDRFRHSVANGLRRMADLIDRASAGASGGREPGAH